MTDFEPKDLPAEVTQDLVQQKFQQLNLQEIGLQHSDFNEVMNAHKELAEMSHNAVAEYGKNIATKTSGYTDELLNLVQNKELDTTGQKLNQVVQVARQLNSSSILNKKKSSGFLGGLISKMKGAKQNFDQHFNSTKEQIDVLVKEIETSQSGLKPGWTLWIKCFRVCRRNTDSWASILRREN